MQTALMGAVAMLAAGGAWAEGCGAAYGGGKYIAAPADPGKSLGYIVQLNDVGAPSQVALRIKDELASRRTQLRAQAAGASLPPALKLRHVFEQGLQGFSVENLTAGEAQTLAKDSRVKCVSPNHVLQLATDQSLPSDSLWNLDTLDQPPSQPLDQRYSYRFTGAGVHVYVVDTGIYGALAEFEGRVGGSYSPLSDPVGTPEASKNYGDGRDCHGHGTKVAGIVGSRTYGVAKRVTLHAVQVAHCSNLNSGEIIAEDDVAKAVDWLSTNAVRPAVVNMSLTTTPDVTGATAMEESIRRAVGRGLHIVVAGGNTDQDACLFSPGRLSEQTPVINVSSLNGRSSRNQFRAVYGRCVSLFAPGVGIASTNLPTKPAGMTDVVYQATEGTSFAAPHVTGIVAQMLEENPSLTPAQMKSRVLAYASGQSISNAGSGSPQAAASIRPLACSLSVSGSRIKSGDYFSFTVSGERLPAGARGYWYGTRNGAVDLSNADAGLVSSPSSSFTYANRPVDQGYYTRRMEIRSADGAPLCSTNTVEVELVAPPSCSLSTNTTVASAGQTVSYFVNGQNLPSGAQGYWYGTKNGVTDTSNALAGPVPNTFSFVTQASWAGNYTRYIEVRDPVSNQTVCTTNSVSVQLK